MIPRLDGTMVILYITNRLRKHGYTFVFGCLIFNIISWRGHGGRHRMVVGFTNTCAISAYHH